MKSCFDEMMKQFDHMIERKLNLELSNVFPRLKFLTGCSQFSDFSNKGFCMQNQDCNKYFGCSTLLKICVLLTQASNMAVGCSLHFNL
jgi:hypothetical protein